jgi:hypothetical protein
VCLLAFAKLCVKVWTCTDTGVTMQNAGGFIEMGRVCGNLAVSRALGDYEYKDRPELGAEVQKVTDMEGMGS